MSAAAEKVVRCHVKSSVSDEYVIEKRVFAKQFSNTYFHRIRALRPTLAAVAKLAEPELPIVEKMLDLHVGQRCVLIGTILKRMKLEPSVLKEYAKERAILPMPVRDTFTSDDDLLLLEDEFGRLPLVAAAGFEMPVHQLVTGVVVAIVGEEVDGGDFIVERILEPGLAPQPPLPLPASKTRKLVALVSDVSLGGSADAALMQEMLADYLVNEASDVCRLIVAGNLMAPMAQVAADAPLDNKPVGEQVLPKLASPVKQADAFLARLCASIDVDVIPGARDPASHALPQQPMSMCMFSVSSHYDSLRATTNPYSAVVGGVHLHGNAGQPLDSLLRYTRDLDEPAAMSAMLRWRHSAPTAPNALPCYPFETADRFVIKRAPHVFFVGDRKEFFTTTVDSVCLIGIPQFSTTGNVVLLDLESLQVQVCNFAVELSRKP